MADSAITDWLLDSDPALRWQVERDLLGAPPEVWEATRARIATEGFGARLLALQDPDSPLPLEDPGATPVAFFRGRAFLPRDAVLASGPAGDPKHIH